MMPEDDNKKGDAWWLTAMAILLLLLLLIGVGFLGWRHFQRQVAIHSTSNLVSAIATAIAIYEPKRWKWDQATPNGPQPASEPMWDINHDGRIDGIPSVIASATTDGGFTPELIASGYSGFYPMVRPPISKRFINLRQQPIDAWGQPLRIAYALGIYAPASYGVWSAGPDGIDATADDLKSWTPSP